MDTRRSLGLLAAAVFGVGAGGCLDNGLKPEPRDTTPPQFQIVTPHDTLYDTDGDRLLDLELTWTDSAGAVDWASVRVRSLGGVNGPADSSTNLLGVWRVERRDTLGLVVHETLENLLHGGANQLEITLPDTAGNGRVDTIAFALPHGAFIRTLITGLSSQTSHGIGMVVCPDDRRAYMTAGRRLVVVDADSLKILGLVFNSDVADDLQIPLCVPGDPMLYVTERVERFHRPSVQWAPRVSPAFGAVGIVQSRADPNIIYVGESLTGGIALIDRAQAARVGSLALPPAPPNEFVFDLEVLPGDTKIYATRYVEGGILVADPSTGQVLARIGVGGPSWPDLGRTDAIVPSADTRWLYAAVLDGDPRGVVAIDTRIDSVVRILPLPDYVPQELALSASEKRMFVTVQDRFPGLPSYNVLVDVPNWRVLESFPRPRPPGEVRFDGGVAFHPNGKLVFVGHNLDVDVYLSRET
ncbi:MAG: YncE family protein [Acidimicrobiales bacterium]